MGSILRKIKKEKEYFLSVDDLEKIKLEILDCEKRLKEEKEKDKPDVKIIAGDIILLNKLSHKLKKGLEKAKRLEDLNG